MEPFFIGQIMEFGGNFAPRSWAFCHGQLLAISEYDALFSILGTTYGGDGRTTFGLPDLRGRVPISEGTGPGLTPRRLGSKGGTETNTLNTQQLASHSHTPTTSLKAKNGAGDETNPGGGYPATAGTDLYADASNTDMASDMGSINVANTGGGNSINNMQPYGVTNYIIALFGLYPSRS